MQPSRGARKRNPPQKTAPGTERKAPGKKIAEGSCIFAGDGYIKNGTPVAGNRGRSGFISVPVEESPDCIERGVLLKRRILRTIRRRKASATERIPPGAIRVRVKGWGKSPPGASARAAPHGKPLPQQDQIGDDAAARGAISPGFWSHRQMIAVPLRRDTESGLQRRCAVLRLNFGTGSGNGERRRDFAGKRFPARSCFCMKDKS